MAALTHVLTEDLIEGVKTSIREKTTPHLKALIDAMRAADVADLVEHLDHDERLVIFELLKPEGAGEVLLEVEAPVQERILNDLDDDAIKEIVEELDSDDAADLVGDLPEERAKEIIETVEEDVSQELKQLLPYPEDSAGGIMALEFVAVSADSTVQEAIELIRKKREEVENMYYLYVVDDHGRLAGIVSLKDLVVESPTRKILKIMNPEVISAYVYSDQEEVAKLVKKYDLVAIPVVDQNQRLVGRITHDDIMDVIEEEADEDIGLMAGVINQEVSEESPLRVSRARLPWLILGLAGELVAAAVIYHFESSLAKAIALACFFPVIMAMGGNTGTQASTVVVRGLATGDIRLVSIGKRLWLELRAALINGFIVASLLGVIVAFWLADYRLGFVVALAMMCVVLNAGFVGSAVPLVMNRLNIDPALATGPFISTSNDIFGLLIYLGLVTAYFKIYSV
ncbi:MAG: magnesium transporter [Deltaproteobacteria bacterium]